VGFRTQGSDSGLGGGGVPSQTLSGGCVCEREDGGMVAFSLSLTLSHTHTLSLADTHTHPPSLPPSLSPTVGGGGVQACDSRRVRLSFGVGPAGPGVKGIGFRAGFGVQGFGMRERESWPLVA
jgi:hypothetical protein